MWCTRGVPSIYGNKCNFYLRYDVRNRLEDKNQFGLKSNLPYRPSAEELELEEELDHERYLALEWDDIRVAEQEGKKN